MIRVILLLVTNFCFSQSMLRIVVDDEDIKRQGIEVYKNGKILESFNGVNKDGYIKLKINEIDTTATYHFKWGEHSRKYQLLWKKIDINRKDTLTVALEKDSYYIGDNYDYDEIYVHFPITGSRFSDYPYKPRSLDELPDSIVTKVTAYLKKRVGKLYDNFHFIKAHVINVDEYNKKKPNYKQKASYFLVFSFRDLEADIEMYRVEIHLDKKGEVVFDANFPEIKSKEQLKIYPYKKIRDKVYAKGYNMYNMELTLVYDNKHNRFLWEANDFKDLNASQAKLLGKFMYYDGYTGKLINRKKCSNNDIGEPHKMFMLSICD